MFEQVRKGLVNRVRRSRVALDHVIIVEDKHNRLLNLGDLVEQARQCGLDR